MSAPNEVTTLLTVDVQANNTRLIELQKDLNANKVAVAELNATFKAGSLDQTEYAAKQVELRTSAAALTQETRVLTKANLDQTTAVKAGTGSIAELRAQLSTGTAAYNALSAAERDNTAAGQKLQATNKATSDQLKVLEKAVGDTRRGVGDYNAGIKDVNVVNGKFATLVDNAHGSLNTLGERAKSLPGPLQAVAGGLAETGKGLLTATKAALAFIATPLGAVLALITAAFFALKTAFTSSEEGQNKYAKLMGIIGSVIGNLVDVVAATGEKIIALFEDPLESAQKFGALIKENIENRFIGLLELIPAVGAAVVKLFKGDFAGAASTATNAVSKAALGVDDLTGKLNRAGAAARSLTQEGIREGILAGKVADQRAQAERIERNLLTERATAEVQIAELQLKARQKEKFGAGERKAALLEAQRLEDGLFDKSKKVLVLRRDAITVENTFSRTNAENLTKEEEAKAAVIRIDAQRAEAQRANIRLLNSLNGQVLADAKAGALKAKLAEQAAREDAVKNQQTLLEQQLLTVVKGSAAELVLLQKKLDLAAKLTLASEKQTAATRRLLLDTVELEKKRLQDDYNAKAIEAAKKHDAATVAEANREYAEAQKELVDFLNGKRAAVESDEARGLISASVAADRLAAISKAGLAAELVNAQDYAKDQGLIQKKIADEEIKQAIRAKDKKREVEQIKRDITSTSVQAGIVASEAIVEALGQESAAGQAALAIKKVLALAEIGINLEKQLAAAALTGAKISESAAPFTVPLGVAYTIATDALAIAAAGASAAKVLGFATGGMVPGSGNGDTVPAMLTPGEVVMNQASSQAYAPLLSYLNASYGGTAFATGTRDGGLNARAITPGGLIDYQQLAAALAKQPVSVDVRAIAVQQGRVAHARNVTTLS